jgi:hypothetical protein
MIRNDVKKNRKKLKELSLKLTGTATIAIGTATIKAKGALNIGGCP